MHLLLQYPILNSNHSFHTTPWVVMCFPHPSNAPGRLKYNVSIAYYPVEQHPAATGKTHDTSTKLCQTVWIIQKTVFW